MKIILKKTTSIELWMKEKWMVKYAHFREEKRWGSGQL
jgi:hypothetical protein